MNSTDSNNTSDAPSTAFHWDGTIPPKPVDPPKVDLFRFIYRASRRNQSVDKFLTSFLTHRHFLTTVAAEDVIPGFAVNPVTVRDLPRGLWATPLVDTLSVLKSAIGFGSRKILEIGSYKGATARLLAENTSPETHIWTLDIDSNHGEAYRGTEHESRIHRLIGRVSAEVIKDHGPFDLIFVDADHDYESAFHHSAVAFGQLAPGGVILWHDYQQNNYLHGGCAVPEALYMAAKEFRRPILSIEGTMLGIYSEHPGWETSMIEKRGKNEGSSDPWSDQKIRQI